MTTVVVMPGGFHPFHAGHAALYQSARRAFPDAEVFVAATNDTSTRPFPFAIKEKLAQLAGVESGHFVQVKSPFRAEEITSRFDPEKDVLIFVRSEKDENKPPQAGGVKKDGSPAYLQKLEQVDRIEPFKKHAYMAYLPTVEFGPGMTSATEIRAAWPKLNEKRKTALVMSLYPATQKNPRLAATVVKMLDAAIGTMSEAVMGGGIRPPPGGATSQPPGIRPPSASQPKPPPPPESDNWMAPHGDARNEYRMFRAGEKPAVIVRGEMTQVYDPLLSTGEYPFKRLTSQGRQDAFVVGQPTEQDRVKKIYMLVQTATDRAEAGDFSAYNNSNYHRTLGRLLGYPEDKITAFINHYFRDREDLAQTIYETGDAEFDAMMRKATGTEHADRLIKRLGQLGNMIVNNPKLWNRYSQAIDNNDIDWVIGLIQHQLNATKEEVVYLSRLFGEIGGGLGRLADFAWAVKEGTWVEDFLEPWEEYKKQGVAENQGWAATLENRDDRDYEADPELKRARLFAKQHYSQHSKDPDVAFDKWVMRSLKHSEEEDREQDQILKRLTAKIEQLAQRLQQVKSQQSLGEESGQMAGTPAVGGMTASYQQRENQPIDEDYVEEKWSNKYKSSINCSNPRGFSQKAHCAGRKK